MIKPRAALDGGQHVLEPKKRRARAEPSVELGVDKILVDGWVVFKDVAVEHIAGNPVRLVWYCCVTFPAQRRRPQLLVRLDQKAVRMVDLTKTRAIVARRYLETRHFVDTIVGIEDESPISVRPDRRRVVWFKIIGPAHLANDTAVQVKPADFRDRIVRREREKTSGRSD